jgi:uncharacterized RDD family membrane protein YckC
MSCPNCGSQTSDDAVRCPACGAPLAARPPTQAPWNVPAGGSWGAPTPGGASQDTGPADPWGPPPGGSFGGSPGGSSWGEPPWGASGGGQPYAPYPTSGWSNEPQSSRMQLAGWWQRVGATLLDGIIIGIPAEVINVAAGRAAYYVFLVVATAIYTTGLLTTRGQTIGMMAAGTKCVHAATGTLLAPGPAFVRWLVGEILDITIVGGILDVLWPLWDANNQTLHDKAVGSIVVRTR